jgi:hypothetical protein
MRGSPRKTWVKFGHNRSFDIAVQIADNLLLAPAPTGAILHPKEP